MEKKVKIKIQVKNSFKNLNRSRISKNKLSRQIQEKIIKVKIKNKIKIWKDNANLLLKRII